MAVSNTKGSEKIASEFVKSSALLYLAVLCSSLAVSGCEPARDAGEALFATNVEGTDATSQGAAEGPVPGEAFAVSRNRQVARWNGDDDAKGPYHGTFPQTLPGFPQTLHVKPQIHIKLQSCFAKVAVLARQGVLVMEPRRRLSAREMLRMSWFEAWVSPCRRAAIGLLVWFR